MTMRLSCTGTEIRGFKDFWDHEFDLLGSRDVIDHVTIGLGVSTFLLVVILVNDDRASILHDDHLPLDRRLLQNSPDP